MKLPPIEHQIFDINQNKVPTLSTSLKCPQVAFAYYPGCDPLLIGNYAACTEFYCGRGYPESTVLVYPGTTAKIGQQETIFGIADKVIFVPGVIYKGCPNKNSYRDVVSRARIVLCLASLPRVLKGQKWVNHKTVVGIVAAAYSMSPMFNRCQPFDEAS